MARMDSLLAIDQGTTSTRAMIFGRDSSVHCIAQREFEQIYPRPGWVEHDAEAIWASVLATVREALAAAELKGLPPAAIGVANQRETTVIWERATGRPIANAIVWQDRRTASRCRDLAASGAEPGFTEKTGLVLDPYFSASKIEYLLDHVDGARAAAEAGKLAFGTIDSFLIWRLTGGRAHITDATNASRTALFDIEAGRWDEDLLELFNIPAALLPEVVDCAGRFGETAEGLFDRVLPITGAAGDQQAAAIGQACFSPGELKSTYGTGAFLLINTGEARARSSARLLGTIAYRLDGKTVFALEGSILSAGATVQWLRDGLGLIAKASEIDALAADADPDSQVQLVPAFAGLGAPHWDAEARGALLGLTRGDGRAEIARAALDSAAQQTCDLLDAMAQDGVATRDLRVDGGMARSDLFLQSLADLSGARVVRPVLTETTAWGAAFLAGLGAGLFSDLEDGRALWTAERDFSPVMSGDARQARRRAWSEAVGRVRSAS